MLRDKFAHGTHRATRNPRINPSLGMFLGHVSVMHQTATARARAPHKDRTDYLSAIVPVAANVGFCLDWTLTTSILLVWTLEGDCDEGIERGCPLIIDPPYIDS